MPAARSQRTAHAPGTSIESRTRSYGQMPELSKPARDSNAYARVTTSERPESERKRVVGWSACMS